MTTKTHRVRIATETVGQHFGTCAVLRDARSGRRLESTDTYPLGFVVAARDAAESIAKKRGWVVED